MNLTTKEILIKAREMIAEPENWCKEAFLMRKVYVGSCNSCGSYVGWKYIEGENLKASGIYSWSPSAAVRYILLGYEFQEHFDSWRNAMHALDASCPMPTITYYNDREKTTHADILAVFDRAISVLKQKEVEQ